MKCQYEFINNILKINNFCKSKKKKMTKTTTTLMLISATLAYLAEAQDHSKHQVINGLADAPDEDEEEEED